VALGIGLVSGAAGFWDGIELFDGELDRGSGAIAASVTGLMGGELGAFELALGFATSSMLAMPALRMLGSNFLVTSLLFSFLATSVASSLSETSITFS
jgi:hypothetical protein